MRKGFPLEPAISIKKELNIAFVFDDCHLFQQQLDHRSSKLCRDCQRPLQCLIQ